MSLPEPPVASSISAAMVSFSPATPPAPGAPSTIGHGLRAIGVVDRILARAAADSVVAGARVIVSSPLPPASTSFAWPPTIARVRQVVELAGLAVVAHIVEREVDRQRAPGVGRRVEAVPPPSTTSEPSATSSRPDASPAGRSRRRPARRSRCRRRRPDRSCRRPVRRRRASFPAPPVIVSAPAPPVTLSLPGAAVERVIGRGADDLSLPLPPVAPSMSGERLSPSPASPSFATPSNVT